LGKEKIMHHVSNGVQYKTTTATATTATTRIGNKSKKCATDLEEFLGSISRDL